MASALNTDEIQNEINDDEKSGADEIRDNSMDIDMTSESIQAQLAELDAMKPARSGYMLFAQSNRKNIGQCGAVSGIYILYIFI